MYDYIKMSSVFISCNIKVMNSNNYNLIKIRPTGCLRQSLNATKVKFLLVCV